MKQKVYRIWDCEVAEAIFFFCQQDEIWDDLCDKVIAEDLSMLEYVYKYRFVEFGQWCQECYGFGIVGT